MTWEDFERRIMIEFVVLVAITLASGCGVTFGVLGLLAWLERRYGFVPFG
jgi:hypothetical protein